MVWRLEGAKMLYCKAITQLTMAEWHSGDWMQLMIVSLPVAPWQDDKSLFKVAAWFFIHFQATPSLSAVLSNTSLRVSCLCFSQLINHPVLLIHARALQLEASKQWPSWDNSEGASRRGKLHIEKILTAPETRPVRSLKTLQSAV